MKLIGASITENIDTFLHAGYISAYPRPIEPSAYPVGSEETVAEKIIELDIQSALQLGHAAGDGGVADASSGIVHHSAGTGNLLIGLLTLTGFLVLYYLARKPSSAAILRPVLGAWAVCAMLLAVSHCKENDTLPTDPPWEGEAVREYLHPETATLAILHGIIRPAIVNIGQRVDVLANIQNEVGLPAKSLTEGEQYALRTYGLDGWGNPFSLSLIEKKDADEHTYWGYTVTSPGPDGTMDTDDDISAAFKQNINDTWGWGADPVYYLVENGDGAALLYHRWNNKMFEYAERDAAEMLTGSELFDLISNDDLNDQQSNAVATAYAAVKADTGEPPLVLQVFKN